MYCGLSPICYRLMRVEEQLNEMGIANMRHNSEYFICPSSKFFPSSNYLTIKDNNNLRISM